MNRPRRLTKESLTDSQDSRHSRGNFVSKKGLYVSPAALDGKEIRILEDIMPRGSKRRDLWYLSYGYHPFTDVPNEQDDGTHFEGKTCWNFLQEEQPAWFEMLVADGKIPQSEMVCPVCKKIREHTDEEGNLDFSVLPQAFFKRNGKDIPLENQCEFGLRVEYNFPILLRESEYESGDKHLVKVCRGRITLVKAIDEKLSNDRYWGEEAILDKDKGHWLLVKGGQKYTIDVTPDDTPLWFDTQGVVHDGWLEEISPNFWSFSEGMQCLEEWQPQLFRS